MKTFPMFLQMAGRRVVITGGGEQAAQKCRLMLKTDARITVLAPELDPELADLAKEGRIAHRSGAITASEFENTALVFIATGCPGGDMALHALAKSAGAIVNVVDQPDLCDAITPSIVDRDPVVVAIGTEGTAPVLGRQIKTRIEQMLEPRLGDLAAMAGRLRGLAAMRLGPRMRRDLWRWVFSGPARDAHARGAERDSARMIKEAIYAGKLPDTDLPNVSLVGAGPGCKDLITLRGVQRLQEADIIFYDKLVDPELLELARRDAERVYVGKAPGEHSHTQDHINRLLIQAVRDGKRVVRLKCGDPGIFARGAEEVAALKDAGFDTEIVPGVTAASACSAQAGVFLTERGKTDTLVFTAGRTKDDGIEPDWAQHMRPGAQIAIYMGLGTAPKIQAALDARGLAEITQVIIVEKSGGVQSRTLRCKGTVLADTLNAHSIEAPAMILLHIPKSNDMATARPPQLAIA